MKSEERHQLLTNDLGVVTAQTAGFLERHLGTTIAVACGALFAVAVGFLWTQVFTVDNSAGWSMLETAQNIEDFGAVVDKFKGQPPAQWAQLQISEKTLQNALPLLFTNRELALTDLKSAREGFDSLLQEKPLPPTVRERALWGFAVCLEAGCEGDTSKPVDAYKRVIDEFPMSIFKTVAEERIAALEKNEAGDFYTWFSKENPKPPEARPRDVKTDGITLPSPGDTPQDGAASDEAAAKTPAAETTPAAAAPANTPADKPADDATKTPETQKPSDPPAESPKPADPKPEESKPVEAEKKDAPEPAPASENK